MIVYSRRFRDRSYSFGCGVLPLHCLFVAADRLGRSGTGVFRWISRVRVTANMPGLPSHELFVVDLL